MSRRNVEIVREIFASAAPITSNPRLAPDAEFDFSGLYPISLSCEVSRRCARSAIPVPGAGR
jgi:hypothetical protein